MKIFTCLRAVLYIMMHLYPKCCRLRDEIIALENNMKVGLLKYSTSEIKETHLKLI